MRTTYFTLATAAALAASTTTALRLETEEQYPDMTDKQCRKGQYSETINQDD